MNIEEAILSRKSVRKFLPTPVSRETVEEILRVAQRAPSGNNIQPWHVYVVAGEARERLCRDVYEAAEKEPERHQAEYDYYPSNWFEPYATRRRVCGYGLYSALGIDRHDKAARERQMLRNYLFFDAPVGMFITLDRRLSTGSYMDTGMFIQNVMLAARAHGLHTCAQAAFAWYHDVIRRHVPIPPEEIVLCGIALGHEDPDAPENAFITERAALEEFVRFYGF